MPWYSIGPDFIAQARVSPFTRLSSRNYWGTMGRVRDLAFEAGAGAVPATVYAVVNDSLEGQVALFRKRDSETVWKCLTDALRSPDNNVDPRCVAVHPQFPQQLYMGTWLDQGLYRSPDRGDTWGARVPLAGRIRKIVVDPRPVSSVNNTILYAATDNGLYRSADNGGTWTLILAGNINSFVLAISGGQFHCYAGVNRSGLWSAGSEPVSSLAWTNLSNQSIGLPAFASGGGTMPDNFDEIRVDCCARNPACAYAWISRPSVPGPTATTFETVGLYKTTSPTTRWTLVSAAPSSGGYVLKPYNDLHYCFAVSPSSPGDGLHDILFFGGFIFHRSIDSGTTWPEPQIGFHVDFMAFGFYPALPPPGTNPAVYICTDGGIASSPAAADPSYAIDAMPSTDQLNAGETVNPNSPFFVNATRGLENCLIHGLSHDPTLPPYIATWDNGVYVRRGAKGWSDVSTGFDGVQVAAAPGPDGVVVWYQLVDSSIGSIQFVAATLDRGPQQSSVPLDVRLDGTSDNIWCNSNFAVDTAKRCLVGAQVLSAVTTLTAPTGVGSNLTLHVVSTAGIPAGAYMRIGNSPGVPLDVTPTSFRYTGLFTASLPAGTRVNLWSDAVVRIGTDGIGRRISQVFRASSSLNYQVILVAAGGSPANRRLACVERDRYMPGAPLLYRVDEAATGGGPATWDLISTDQPPNISPGALLITRSGDLYVVLVQAVAVMSGATPINTPLFKVPVGGSSWVGQQCDGLPGGVFPDGTPHPFGPLVEDPITDNVLYGTQGGKVFRLVPGPSPNRWTWTPFSDALPGALITNLVTGNIAPMAAPPFPVLRASTLGRGVWETTLHGAAASGSPLYVRRTILDQGWTSQIDDGVPNPYQPSAGVWHWESPDLKIELARVGAAGSYYQSDPEASGTNYTAASPPNVTLNHVQFQLLNDLSQEIPSLATVRVHVQVQGRTHTPMSGVSVWVLWTQCGAGLPLLNETVSGVTFNFWDQFQASGAIVSVLPADSRWKQVAAPVQIAGLDADHPQIASFVWQAPMVPPATTGHYCMAVFLHSMANPIGETVRMSVDEIVLDNKQVGQRNLHVLGMGAPLPVGPFGAGSSPVSIAFNAAEGRESAAKIDWLLDDLPKGATLALQFPRMELSRPLSASLQGYARVERPGLLAALGYIVSDAWDRFLRRIGLRGRALPPVSPVKYIADQGARVSLDGLLLHRQRVAAARMTLVLRSALEPGSVHSFAVLQWVRKRVTGGSTFQILGPALPHDPEQPPFDEEDFSQREREGQEHPEDWLPPLIVAWNAPHDSEQ